LELRYGVKIYLNYTYILTLACGPLAQTKGKNAELGRAHSIHHPVFGDGREIREQIARKLGFAADAQEIHTLTTGVVQELLAQQGLPLAIPSSRQIINLTKRR